MRKIKTAMSKGDKATADRLKENKPTLQLDHLVKERYVNIYLQYNIVHLIILFLLLLDTPHLMMPWMILMTAWLFVSSTLHSPEKHEFLPTSFLCVAD